MTKVPVAPGGLSPYGQPKANIDPVELQATILRDDFYEFVKEMWDTIVAERPVWNWHIRKICKKLEFVCKRIFKNEKKRFDLVVNVPPGMSKSLLMSVFLPAWCTANMPSFRFIGASYSYDLQMDLSSKCRDVIESEKYQKFFPHVKLRDDQNTKRYFKTSKGGFRYAVGMEGSITGFHAHCLPWESEIVTDQGAMPIGKIVDDQVCVNIMTLNHETGKPRWQPVERFVKNPGRPLCRVSLSDGTAFELTHDHPVYVTGRGYVPAIDLLAGDEVVRHAQVARDEAEEGLSCDVREVRFRFSLHGEAGGGVEVGEGVLFQGLFGRGEAIPRQEEVRGVRGRDSQAVREAPVLQQQVSVTGDERTGPPEMEPGPCPKVGVSEVQESCRVQGSGERGLLLEKVCGRGSRRADGRSRELELRSRPQSLPVPAGVRQGREGGPETGGAGVLPVRDDREGGGTSVVRSSRGLRQGEQRPVQPGRTVPVVPRGQTPEGRPGAAQDRPTVVTAVEPAVRVPAAVYDLQVAQDHNFFADGTLVHNCIVIDDPLDPNMAASDVELKRTNNWIKDTLSSRKVSKTVSVMVLVMQRLHEDDPTHHFLQKKRVRHVKLPAEVEDDVVPKRWRRYYKDGLLDRKRLPKEELDELLKDLGPQQYAAQYRQSPVPPGGAMFDVDKVQVGVPGPMARVARFWDKATTAKKGAAYTAGVLMGVDGDGRYWVLDVVRGRWNSYDREKKVSDTADADPDSTEIGIEQEPGSGGKNQAEDGVRRLAGFRVRVIKSDASTGGKERRAEPFSAQVNGGNVFLAAAGKDRWHKDYLAELRAFPFSKYKDQVDASSGAFSMVHRRRMRAGACRSKGRVTRTVTV